MSESPTRAGEGQYLTFMLQNQGYGVPILSVREINQIVDITPIPKAPRFVKGVINLRGKIIPVVDLPMKFGMGTSDFSRETCIVVIETDSGQVGIIVDRVSDVVELGQRSIEPPPALGDSDELRFLMGMGKVDDRVLLLVDIRNALSRDEFLKHITFPDGKAA